VTAAADLARARAMLAVMPLIDGHNDLPWALREAGRADFRGADLAGPVAFTHTDLPRMAAGGLSGQFWSVYVPAGLQGQAAVTATLEQIDLVHWMIQRYPDRLELALDSGDVERAMGAGRVASLLGAEGGHCIDCSMGVLRMLYALGVRYLTLTHNASLPWADAATGQQAAGGLTAFGREVIREMQRLGMLVDLSHVSPDTMRGALAAAEAPVIFSHSSARALCDHPRNVPDDVLAALAARGGVCMVTFVPAFVSPAVREWDRGLTTDMERRGLDPWHLSLREAAGRDRAAADPPPRATVADVAAHVEHVREVAGIEHAGLGGDFDGGVDMPGGPGLDGPGLDGPAAS